MKLVTFAAFFCLLAAVSCQTQHKNGNPTGEIGQPAFDEIIVESTLTVRGKSGSRSGKSLITNVSPLARTANPNTEKPEIIRGSSTILSRARRSPQRYGGYGGQPYFPSNPHFGYGFNHPSSSSSAAQASSNAFNSNTPFGNFGAAASQASSQSQNYGPNGFEGSAGHTASQTYYLPNGNKIDVTYSQSYNVDNGRPNFANSHAITITSPDGKVRKIAG